MIPTFLVPLFFFARVSQVVRVILLHVRMPFGATTVVLCFMHFCLLWRGCDLCVGSNKERHRTGGQ